MLEVNRNIYSIGDNNWNECGISAEETKLNKIKKPYLLTNEMFPNLQQPTKARKVIAGVGHTIIIFD